MNELKFTSDKIVKSFIWKFIERISVQGIQYFFQIILARLLLPEDFGLISILMGFIIFSNIFTQSGFNTALIQKKNVDDIDFSSVFYISLIISTVLYSLIFLLAPEFSAFLSMPQITNTLRVLALLIFFSPIQSIQNAKISRTMNFKILVRVSTISVLVSGITGSVLAILGKGVWSLIIQQLVYNFLMFMLLWYKDPWYPKLNISINRIKSIYKFSWKILATNLLVQTASQIRNIIIGKEFSSQTLGYYYKGSQLPSLAIDSITGATQSVLLPTFSSKQDNIGEIKLMLRKAITISSYILFPALIGLVIIAKPLLIILLTEKWLPAVPYFQIYCIIYLMQPKASIHLQAMISVNKANVYLISEVIKRAIDIMLLFITVIYFENPIYIALSFGITMFISAIINSYQFKKYFIYSYREQLKDVAKTLVMTSVMGLLIYSFKFFIKGNNLLLVLQIIFGIIIYLSLSILTRNDSFLSVKKTIVSIVKK